MNAPRRLAALPLPACLLRTTRRLTSSRFPPSGKSLPSSPLVLTTSRRIAPKLLLLIGLAALAILVLTPGTVDAQAATGLPRIVVSAESPGILAVDTWDIRDADGLPYTDFNDLVDPAGSGAPENGKFVFDFSYQWIRVDGVTEVNVGADSPRYQLVDADFGKKFKVRVSFTDRANNAEAVTSVPFGPIARPVSLPSPSTLVANTGETAGLATTMITSDPSDPSDYAIGFKLGDHGQGYEISSVLIDLAAVPSSLSVSLWTSGLPGGSGADTRRAKLFEFENPGSFQVGLNEFTAPAGVHALHARKYWIVLSGFGSSLSIEETTSDEEDAGGEPGAVICNISGNEYVVNEGEANEMRFSCNDEPADTSVLRLAIKGWKRSTGILAANLAQPKSDGLQEIISVGDKIGWTIDLGQADRFLVRGVAFAMDDTTSRDGGIDNPWFFRSNNFSGTRHFRLFQTRDVNGLPTWTAPQGATVPGDSTYAFQFAFGSDHSFTNDGDTVERIGAVLSRTRHVNRAVDGRSDAPTAAGTTLGKGEALSASDAAGPTPLMVVYGVPLHAMVQNPGQADNSYASATATNAVLSQGFTTGPDARGYVLQGIGINIEGSGGNVPDDAASVSVAVHADSSGKPGAKLFDLFSPTEYAAGHSFFEAPPGTTLEASTSYVLVWSHLGGAEHRLHRTLGDNEDAGALTGFSIANVFYRGADVDNLTANSTSNALEIAVYTDRDLSPPKRVTAFDLDSNNSTPRGVWGNDDTFWVANDGSGATDKLYAYNRSDGSRDSSSDFDNLNTAGNNDVRGICSDGTTMFVADSGDDEIYAYRMSDKTRISTREVTLDSANNSPQGLSCDRTHLWVAEDNDDLTSKVFVYLRSDGSHVSTLDIGASTLNPSSTVGAINNNDQRGMWSNGTTLFVVDHGDTKVYGYQLSDRSRDDDKNLDLDSANTNPWGLWFDGRVLWVADTADDRLYVYDLPGAQPGNTVADGVPGVRTATTEDVWSATLTAGTNTNGIGYLTDFLPTAGSLTTTTFDLGGTTYTIRNIFDDDPALNAGGLVVIFDQAITQQFNLSIGTSSYFSDDALPSTIGGAFWYAWVDANLSWSVGETIAISLDVDAAPTDGVELRADTSGTSGITDDTDGLDNVFYHYQWIRVDGTTVTELDGETGPTYTTTADDVTKGIQVRVIFDDDLGYREYPRYSPQVTVREVPPVVTSVTLTSDPGSDGIPDYAIGESVTATVTFDKAVDVTSGPQITLLVGTADKAADCAAVTNTTTMECSYEVAANDTAPDGVGIKANTLTLNSGTIYATGSTTNAATLTHSAQSLQSGHVVDGIRPTLVTTGSDAPRTSGDGSEFILTFSENINIDDSKFKLFESTTALSTTAFTSLHNKLTIELTTAVLSSAGPLTVELEADAVEDLVGNGILAVGSTTVLNQVSAAPSAPTNLMAEPAPDETPQLAVDLSWTAPTSDGGSAITSHQYRYKVGSGSLGGWTTIDNSAAGGTNATSFTVTGLPTSAAPIVFMFEVRAINANGNGSESDPATATIDVPDNIGVSMATVGNRQVTLTWSTPNNNGSAILRYVYWVYDEVTETFVVPQNTTIPNSDADTTSFTITGLTNGVEYLLVIKAVNTVGAPDDDPGSYMPMAGPPGKPSVTVQSRVAALYVSWTLEDDGGSNITEYQVQWKSGAQTFDSSRQQAGLTATNTRIENLINGTEYDVQVRAMNSAGWGEWSDIDSGTPVEGPAVSLSAETLQVDEGGSGAYFVVITTEPTATVTIAISRGGDVTTQPNNLRFTASNWETRQRVTVNAGQDGDADDDTVAITHTVFPGSAAEYLALTDVAIVQVTVLDDDVPPPAVRGFTAADESQDAVALSWWSERGAAEYELEHRKQGDTGNWTRVTRGDFDHRPSTSGNRSLTAIATGLDCNTTYDFRIRLRGSGDLLLNIFGPHTEISQKTGQCAQPDRPTNLMYTLAPDCATLTWTAPTGGDYTGVRIRRLTRGEENYTVIHESLNSRPTSYRDCTNTGDGYGNGDNPWYAYRVTYVKFESGLLVESKHAKSGLHQYGPAFQDHLHATPRNVRLTRDTDSQRRMSWEAPPSWSLTTWAGLQGASVPVRDPWITGYVVERREFRARADGYLYFSDEDEDLTIWSATMTVGESGGTDLGYVEGSYGGLTPTVLTLSSGRHRVNALHGGNTLQLSIAPIPPGDALEDWVLVIDGDPLPFEDGTINPAPDVGVLLVTWDGQSPSWANGQQVSVQLVDRDRYGWKTVREGGDANTSTSFTDNEQANGRKFVYRVRSTNKYGVSTTHSIFDWLWDSPHRDAVIDLAATDTTTDDSSSGSTGDGRTNNAATGAPTISGTPQVGGTLTASTSPIDDRDGLTNVTYRYQWIAGGSDIGGATGSSHTLTASEQGKTIRVRVTFTDDADNEETLTSEATVAVAAAPEPLTASRPDSRFQSARHKGADDRPQVIVAFSLPVASFPKTTPSVLLTGATVSSVRQHEEDGIKNAWIFFLDPDGTDDIVFNLVTGQPCDSGGICTEDGRTLSLGVQVILPGPDDPNSPATGAPTVGGTPQVGETLTASTSDITDQDGLTNVSYGYQWIAGGTNIDGATGSSHTLTASEQGQTIQVRVTFTDDADNEETLTSVATVAVAAAPNREATGKPTISGTPQVDQTLTAETSPIDDADGLTNATFEYQWIAGGSDIAGATGSTHTLTASEQGQTIQVRVTFTDDADNEETLTSEATEAVAAAPNRDATGVPTISGTPQVDQTLTADTANIVDQDGITGVSYTYQWTAGGSDIDGATGSSYTLTASEQGQTIQVRVTFTDDADNEETLTSEATVAVAAAPNRSATGKPTIGGTPQVDQTLTADTSPIDDADGLTNVSYRYQWTAGGTDIEGATGASFTLTASQQGKTIQVQVTFTDDRGNAESLTSEPTDAVAAKPTPLTVRLKAAAPATHDGSSEFTFEIEFSEEFGISYATLRDHAFTVTGGSVEKAQRTDKPSNIPWRIEIKPQGNGDVTITLPATTDCDADGAICTGDGRKLSNSLSFTVSGPGQ